MNQRRNEELSQVVEQANRIIRQIAEQEKYDIIFQEAVYASPRIDITDKVIKALDSRQAARQMTWRRPLTLAQIASRLGGRVVGDPDSPDPAGRHAARARARATSAFSPEPSYQVPAGADARLRGHAGRGGASR